LVHGSCRLLKERIRCRSVWFLRGHEIPGVFIEGKASLERLQHQDSFQIDSRVEFRLEISDLFRFMRKKGKKYGRLDWIRVFRSDFASDLLTAKEEKR
jgi:hypothetical protein